MLDRVPYTSKFSRRVIFAVFADLNKIKAKQDETEQEAKGDKTASEYNEIKYKTIYYVE